MNDFNNIAITVGFGAGPNCTVEKVYGTPFAKAVREFLRQQYTDNTADPIARFTVQASAHKAGQWVIQSWVDGPQNTSARHCFTVNMQPATQATVNEHGAVQQWVLTAR